MAQTLSQIFQRITSSNTHYNDYYDRWLFMLESYLGGDEYRKGNHLTKYQLESDGEYRARLRNTPLDNHCRSVVNVYNSFLFRKTPERELGSLSTEPNVKYFLKDADLEGRSFDDVMKEVATWSSVFGHVWCLMSKANVGATTRAEEIMMGVRPQVSILTPLVVHDWRYERLPNGYYDLTYFKYTEDVNDQRLITVIEWTKDTITTSLMTETTDEIVDQMEVENQLGFIPVTIAYNKRSTIRGIGVSDITDIADQQRAIYNELSEIEQAIRLDSHPTLVTPENVKLGSGAGAIAYMPETLDPGLKPYLLQNGGGDISSIYASIASRVESIDKMANTGAIRATTSRTMSGIAMQTEQALLNARLAEKASNLELAEEQLWRLYANYQGYIWDGEIEYNKNFNIHDEAAEFEKLVKAAQVANTPETQALIEYKMRYHLKDPRLHWKSINAGDDLEAVTKLQNLDAITNQIAQVDEKPVADMEHPETTEENRTDHIQEMIMQGYSDEEILGMHNEITAQDILDAKRDLLDLNGD